MPAPACTRASPVANGDRADGDAEIQVAGEIDVADRAGIEIAPRRLELRRGSASREFSARRRRCRPGKQATSASRWSRRSASRAVHGRHQVHDVRVTLERHVLRDACTVPNSHTRPEIVPAEIDEHHVLGAFLLVALQLLGQTQILVVVLAARPRAGDRMRLDPPSFDAHQHLR